MCAKVLLIALLVPAAYASDDPCSADFPANNGFALDECGKDANKKCCHPKQEVCLEGTPKTGDDMAECSKTRALYGMKVVTVFLIPILASVFLLASFIIMVKQVKNMEKPKPPLAVLPLPQTLLANILVFSPLWKFGLYSAFVAIVVFFTRKVKGNKWVILSIVVLQVFNLVAAMGSYGGTSGIFVPVGLLSSDNVKSWEAGAIDTVVMGTPFSGAACSAYYGNYFDVTPMEKMIEEADPLVSYFGYCSDVALALDATVVMGKIVLQLFMLLLSLQLMVEQFPGGEQEKMKSEF